MEGFSNTFKRGGSLLRWRFFTDGDGKAWKSQQYYHRKARKWIDSGKVYPHRYGNESGKRDCLRCGKPLVAIGADRANGKGHYADWASRRYHIKCLKELGR